MTVYHYGEEVEIVGGDVKEGWALVEFDDGDVVDVDVSKLNADEATAEIYNPAVYEDGLMDYSEHLPLRTEQGGMILCIKTNNGEIIYEVDFDSYAFKSDDEYEVTAKADEAVHWVRWTYEMPKRVLWNKQDKLMEVE